MGGKWEVKRWVCLDGYEEYGYEGVYLGPSLVRAVIHMIRSKRAGAGCVTLHWR